VKERSPSRGEIRLGRREIALVSVGLVVVCGLVFVLGILVGRELPSASRPAAAVARPPAPPRAAPTPEPAREARTGIEEKLTFYQTLTSPTADVPPPGATASRKVVEERMVVKEPERRSTLRPTPRTVEPAAPPQRFWTVQVSSFRSRALADEQKNQLAAKGLSAYLTTVQSEDGRTRYRVRVGSFATRTEAERLSDRLRADFRLNPFVTTRTP
jgi:cell division protein FtsN